MDISLSYKVESCIKCGFQFAVPSNFHIRKKEDHKTFYCPSCKHSMYYPADNELEKLKKKTKRLKTRLNDEISYCIAAREQANHLEKRVYGYQGYAAKLKKQLKKAHHFDAITGGKKC